MDKDDAWNLVDMLVCYFKDRADIKDSDDNVQRPNLEMQYQMACKELLEWIDKQP